MSMATMSRDVMSIDIISNDSYVAEHLCHIVLVYTNPRASLITMQLVYNNGTLTFMPKSHNNAM
jgi:hypothetical protein